MARYVDQNKTELAADDQHWARMLLQNANLAADTPNSVTFQFTAGAAMRKNEQLSYTFNVTTTEIRKISDACKASKEAASIDDMHNSLEQVRPCLETILNRADAVVEDGTQPSRSAMW